MIPFRVPGVPDPPAPEFRWDRSLTLALAAYACSICAGSGLNLGPRGRVDPCGCVLRSIFRICYNRFLRCATQEPSLSRVSMEPRSGGRPSSSWGRKDEEYIADFCLTAKRTLNEGDFPVFRHHFVLGADWKACCGRLGMERGNFFHAVYRIEEQLGRMFAELTPYPLFPVEDYFKGPMRR